MTSIVVLSQWLTPDRKLNDSSIARIEKGLELLARGADYIVMNGGPGKYTQMTPEGMYIPRGTHPVHSEVMAQYAMERGVPKQIIGIQDYSSDSVGEAYFGKEMILAPNNLRNIIVVTNGMHLPRVKAIYEKILGKEFNAEFADVESPCDLDANLIENEQQMLQLFLRQFGHLSNGNSEGIERVLYKEHKLYSQIPESERWIKGKSPVKRIGEF